MPFTLPNLPYAYGALEPYIDARTMEIHHTKHHQAYINKANKALEQTKFSEYPADELLRNLNDLPANIRNTIRDNAGGHANHSLFWEILAPDAGGKPSGDLGIQIEKTWGNFETFQGKFQEAATNQFGSGWAWLVVNEGRKLEVISTPNQDSPLLERCIPVLGLDVWEHAYYLNYQNRRPEYITSWWNIVNWKKAGELFLKAA